MIVYSSIVWLCALWGGLGAVGAKPKRRPRPLEGEVEAARNNVVMSAGNRSCPDVICYLLSVICGGCVAVASLPLRPRSWLAMPRVCPRVPPRGKRQLRGGPTRGLSRMHTTRLPPTPTPVSYVHGICAAFPLQPVPVISPPSQPSQPALHQPRHLPHPTPPTANCNPSSNPQPASQPASHQPASQPADQPSASTLQFSHQTYAAARPNPRRTTSTQPPSSDATQSTTNS